MMAVGDRLLTELAALGVEAELVEPGVSMPTVPLAAAAIGVSESSIIKSVLFEDRTGLVVLAIANGTSRVSRKLLAEAFGASKLWLASPELVLERTGFPAGGVAPVCHRHAIPVIVDAGVTREAWVYGGAGTEDALLKIQPADIVRVTNAKITQIVEPSAT
jgi:prolyl-tRNA editing enzyme YbaK/EbsC (Cys-tRNA(Pro) deacylase)